ncbi:LysE/ArgO family amino acid transporter [Robbsia sp. KACC 23696]|uniref:LysE/ArgO family amino acid transporter n=1 Tax=Robbsia sp. KACC 23696 TaxID=3149231 RepID=UPI00325A94C5
MIFPSLASLAVYVPALLSGFGLTAGLIVAIGAQNAFVLKQGVQGMHIGAVVLLCCVYDIVLEACGLAGMGGVILAHPGLIEAVRYGGAAMLTIYALRSWRAAWRGATSLTAQAAPELVSRPARPAPWATVSAAVAGAQGGSAGTTIMARGSGPLARANGNRGLRTEAGSLRKALMTVTLLTWLNPHVYLDTVVLLGGVGGRLPWPSRGWFGVGAMAASCIWFVLLGYGARRLSGLFARPAAWRILDASIGCVMFAIAASLLLARFPA